jgi:hypothetical protein
MRYARWTLTSAMALIALTTNVAYAADLCFQYGSGGGIVVARNATIPPQNECATLALYEVGGAGLEGAATGSICQDWAGATVIFHYTYDACIGRPGSYFESATCRLKLRDQSGLPTTFSTCRGKVNNGEFTDDTLKLWSCDATKDITLRVPADDASVCQRKQSFSHGIENGMTLGKNNSKLKMNE